MPILNLTQLNILRYLLKGNIKSILDFAKNDLPLKRRDIAGCETMILEIAVIFLSLTSSMDMEGENFQKVYDLLKKYKFADNGLIDNMKAIRNLCFGSLEWISDLGPKQNSELLNNFCRTIVLDFASSIRHYIDSKTANTNLVDNEEEGPSARLVCELSSVTEVFFDDNKLRDIEDSIRSKFEGWNRD